MTEPTEKHGENVESGVVVPRKRDNSYFWRSDEDRYIRTHRMDGYLLLSEMMTGRGWPRSPESIKKHAKRKLGINLSKYPESGMHRGISCGKWDVRPNSHAGRMGLCPACWRRRQAEAIREGMDEKKAEAEYQREKKRRRDARKRLQREKEKNNGRDYGTGSGEARAREDLGA